jgi:hypothetical protein
MYIFIAGSAWKPSINLPEIWDKLQKTAVNKIANFATLFCKARGEKREVSPL